MARHKHANVAWNLRTNTDNTVPAEHIQWALLMDIRDELQAIRLLANCYRIPRALDAMAVMGADLRRKKRLAAKKRKAAKS